MKAKNLAEKVVVVPGESKGIVAAIAKLMRRRSVIDIVERFQKRHALQEEREMGSARDRATCRPEPRLRIRAARGPVARGLR